MKDKIMYLILGILIGAVITAGSFLIFQKNSRPEMPENFRGGREFRKEDFDDEEFQNKIKNGEIPEKVPNFEASNEASN